MLNYLVYYSGLFAATSALSLVALPSILAKFNRKKYPISYFSKFSKVGWVFSFGVIITAIFQFILIYKISNAFPNILNMGLIVFTTGSVSLLFAGLVSYSLNFRLHTLFASAYFSLNAIGEAIISLQVISLRLNVSLWGGLISAVAFLLMPYLYFVKKNNSLCEYLGILCSCLWVLGFYLF